MTIQTDRTGLGSRITERLDDLGKTQGDLARELGIKQGAVSQWVTGATKPKRIDEIAAFLKTTTEWLRTGKGERVSPLSASLGAITEPRKPVAGKTPLQQARDLEATILQLCAELDPEAQPRVDVDRLAADIREILNQVPKQHKSPLKKSSA
jgi:transcriptional regulator with XRE-family HTH domain